jgi:hypothetical protein
MKILQQQQRNMKKIEVENTNFPFFLLFRHIKYVLNCKLLKEQLSAVTIKFLSPLSKY